VRCPRCGHGGAGGVGFVVPALPISEEDDSIIVKLMQEIAVEAVKRPLMNKEAKDAYAAGYRDGQESMRERAKDLGKRGCEITDDALPIEPPEDTP